MSKGTQTQTVSAFDKCLFSNGILDSPSYFVKVLKSLKVTRVRKLPGGPSTVNGALEQGPVAGSGPRPVLKWYSGATPRELIETSTERVVLE